MHERVVNVGRPPMMVVGKGDALAEGCIVELVWLTREDKNRGFERYGGGEGRIHQAVGERLEVFQRYFRRA